MPFNELEVSKTLTIIKVHQDDGKWFFDSIISSNFMTQYNIHLVSIHSEILNTQFIFENQ